MPQLVVTLVGDWGLILIEILLVEILLKQAPRRYSLKLPETATVGYGVGQGWVLQACVSVVPQSFVLLCVPPAQETLQALQAPHKFGSQQG